MSADDGRADDIERLMEDVVDICDEFEESNPLRIIATDPSTGLMVVQRVTRAEALWALGRDPGE